MNCSIQDLHEEAQRRPLRIHEFNFSETAAARCRKIYNSERGQYDELQEAADEGVFEITIRSRTHTVIVPVDMSWSADVVSQLGEFMADRLAELEKEILYHLTNAPDEQEDRDGTSPRAQALPLIAPQRVSAIIHPATESLTTATAEPAAA
jgi:hypothetical protein